MGKPHKARLLLVAIGLSLSSVSLTVLGWSYFTFLHRYRGKAVQESESTSQISTLVKQKDQDFVILNLADIQICDLEDLFTKERVHKEITRLVEEIKPNLITLTGDQTWSNENLLSITAILSWLEDYKIPYAPVIGNHDHGNSFSSAVVGRDYLCDLYEGAAHCLFKRGPSDIGTLGNYAVNIQEGDEIIRTLYFMDLGYLNEITEGQSSWFASTADSIKEQTEAYVPGMIFTHKELPEVYQAYRHYLQGTATAEGAVHVHYGFAGVTQTGFASLAKSKGVTDFLCGHEHGNTFTIVDGGARYTFCLKTGEYGGFYEDETVYLNGATVIRIGESTSIEHRFVTQEEYRG